MHHRIVFSVLAGSLLAACASRESGQQAASKPPPQPAMAHADLAPMPPLAPPAADPARDAQTHAKYSDAVGEGPRSAMDPGKAAMPTPALKLEPHPDVGVDAAIKLVPSQIPQGHLSKSSLESPLKDPTRYERCAIPSSTRVAIRVAVYDGQAIGVDVRSNPNTPALDFCVDRIVRQTTWIKELAINQVNLTL